MSLAATVARDTDLAAHPSVLLYDNLVSKEYINARFQGIGNPPNPPTVAENVEIIPWPQYGPSAARCWAITTNQRVVAWHHWAEPKRAGVPWTRDCGDGHEHFRRIALTGAMGYSSPMPDDITKQCIGPSGRRARLA